MDWGDVGRNGPVHSHFLAFTSYYNFSYLFVLNLSFNKQAEPKGEKNQLNLFLYLFIYRQIKFEL